MNAFVCVCVFVKRQYQTKDEEKGEDVENEFGGQCL